MRSYMKYNTVIYGFYRAKKGIDFGKSLFVLEGILCFVLCYGFHVVSQGGTSVPVHFVDAGAFGHGLCA